MPRVPFAELVIIDTGELCGDIDVDVEGHVEYDHDTDMYMIDIESVTANLSYGALVDGKYKAVDIDISPFVRRRQMFVERLESQVIESHPKGRP